MFPDRSVNRSGDPELLAAAGKFFFYFCCFSDSSDPVSGTVDLYIVFALPFDETYVKEIMKGWPIQRVFMHSADILAFCGSPDFIFAWPDFWDPGRQWGLLGSLLCGTYCTFLPGQDRVSGNIQ